MYNPKSSKAEEFIAHEEVLASLEYGEKNKSNVEEIDRILNKAREKKGITHREAMVLLDCDIEEKSGNLRIGKRDQRGILRKPYCNVCTVISVQLLYQRL